MRIGYPRTLGTGSTDSYPFNGVFTESIRVAGKDIRAGAVDALVIWGGEDISPSLYKHRTSSRTWAEDRPSTRDMVEMEVFHAARDVGIPIIGICRGAQLACALSGGSLIQHVNNHTGGNHGVVLDKGGSIKVTSCHHQMMYPFEVEHRMIGVAQTKLSRTYIGQDDEEIEFMHRDSTPEPEIVFFPKTNCLAIQGHPEFVGDMEHEFIKTTLDLTRKLMAKEL